MDAKKKRTFIGFGVERETTSAMVFSHYLEVVPQPGGDVNILEKYVDGGISYGVIG
jgi:hypothetical protein